MPQPKVSTEQISPDLAQSLSITKGQVSDWGWITITGITGGGSPAHEVVTTEELLIVDATLGDIVINLHSASEFRFRPLNIKRIDGAAANNVFVNSFSGSPAELIDGDAQITVDGQWTNITLYPIDILNQWFIL